MKRNTGFTLAELLGVIVILGLIALVTIPAITDSLKRYRNNMYQVQVDNIVQAAKNWGSDHLLQLPDVEGGTIVITISDLQAAGYLKGELKNPDTKEDLKTDAKITIKRVGKNYQYTLDESQL